ncbi:hypothetical protein [Deinococcus cellulosilyticus]|uniref:Uncharacterized protein n=1 Tax=Deinococcus cellulosilyticus (strain DSM 18568 / NBRC 106333 / KACC 11606 / 5516J-15) TaxID=1223518 RepID=A0A511N917_DEIC1|nr:hypothetical protein [Deinococcus cellulosilyticus]GEM49027.1 hypothetical protein DC3_46620 [Deinococcus cellulosilyticus NBRC 106333 = KACC 11606]
MKRIISTVLLLCSFSAAQGVVQINVASNTLEVASFKEGVNLSFDLGKFFAVADARKIQYDPKSCNVEFGFRGGTYFPVDQLLMGEKFNADDDGYQLIQSGENYGIYFWKGKRSVKDTESKSLLKFVSVVNEELQITAACNATF